MNTSLQHGLASLTSDSILSTSDIPLLEQITGVDFDGDGLTGSYGTVSEVSFNPTHNFRSTTIDDRYVYLTDSGDLVLSADSFDAGQSLANDQPSLERRIISLLNADGSPYTPGIRESGGTKIVKGATRILFDSSDWPSDRSYFYDPSSTIDNSPIGYSLFLVGDNFEVERVVFDKQGRIIRTK